MALYQGAPGAVFSSSHLAKTLNPNRCAVGRPLHYVAHAALHVRPMVHHQLRVHILGNLCHLCVQLLGACTAAAPVVLARLHQVRGPRPELCRRGVGRAIEAARRRWSRRLRARRSGLPELPPPTTDLLPDPAVCGLAEGTRCFAWPAIVSRRGPAVCGLAEAFGRVSLPAYSALSDRDDPAVCGRAERRPVWFGEPLLLLVLLWSIWASLAELAGFLLREDDGCAVCGLFSFFGCPGTAAVGVYLASRP